MEKKKERLTSVNLVSAILYRNLKASNFFVLWEQYIA